MSHERSLPQNKTSPMVPATVYGTAAGLIGESVLQQKGGTPQGRCQKCHHFTPCLLRIDLRPVCQRKRSSQQFTQKGWRGCRGEGSIGRMVEQGYVKCQQSRPLCKSPSGQVRPRRTPPLALYGPDRGVQQTTNHGTTTPNTAVEAWSA